jgi:hypothetical protein
MREIVRVVEENSLRVTETGFEVQLRLKWYRSLPLSCIEKLQLSLDGQPVDQGLMRFGINGHQYRLEELKELVEEFWFIQDSAILSIIQPGIVRRGESHKIEVELAMRYPYIPIGPGKFLTQINKYSAAQVAG